MLLLYVYVYDIQCFVYTVVIVLYMYKRVICFIFDNHFIYVYYMTSFTQDLQCKLAQFLGPGGGGNDKPPPYSLTKNRLSVSGQNSEDTYDRDSESSTAVTPVKKTSLFSSLLNSATGNSATTDRNTPSSTARSTGSTPGDRYTSATSAGGTPKGGGRDKGGIGSSTDVDDDIWRV